MAERRVEKDHQSPNQHQLSENSYRKAFKIFSDSCGKLSKYSGIPTANDQNISNCLEYSLVFQNIVHFSPYSPIPKKSTMNEEQVVSGEVEAEAYMEVSTYMARIGFEGKPTTSLDCLARLQAAHQHAVPYENLDVFLGHKKVLEVAELFKKMVVEGRGDGAASSTDSSAGFSRKLASW